MNIVKVDGKEINMEGFYKVNQNGTSIITVDFYNPETGEERHCVVRDYDYYDGSRDCDELYNMEINQDVRIMWLRKHGVICPGDTVMVIKGRKVPVGTIAKVTFRKPYFDKYRRWVCDYLYFDNGMKTNVDNCILIVDTSN